ncbi:hypothetical protein [Rhodococcus triatomae]|nr:hypothetical protein G419_25232 [Rhodococcus triatomae BKS 15-14]
MSEARKIQKKRLLYVAYLPIVPEMQGADAEDFLDATEFVPDDTPTDLALKAYGWARKLVRATDFGDPEAVEALNALGLGDAGIQDRLLTGGDAGKEALGELVSALLAIEDPAEQAETAVALFGTEDGAA